MFHTIVLLAIGAGVGILIGVSFGSKVRTEIKVGFDNLAGRVEAAIIGLGTKIEAALKAKL